MPSCSRPGEQRRIGQAEGRRSLQYQPLRLAQAEPAVQLRYEADVDGELVELESERAGVVGVDQKQVEQRLELGMRTVAAAVSDDALRGDEDRLEEQAVGGGAALDRDRGPQQGDQLLPALEAPARVHEPPTGVAYHALCRRGPTAPAGPA